MRIAFLVNNYPPRTGGVELHVQSLAEELRIRGHDVLIVTLGPEVGHQNHDGIEVITLPEHLRVADTLGFPSPGTRRRLTRILDQHRIDVVSVHTRFFPMSYLGFRAARRLGIPVVHTEHGSDHVASPSALIRAASKLVDFTLGRAVLRNATAVLGVSEEVCVFVEELASVKAELFYNAIHLSPPTQAPPLSRPNHLIFVGRLVPGKGWEAFLDVVKNRHEAGHIVVADILGDGPDLDKLKQNVERFKLDGVVDIHGRVPPSRVREAMSGATLLNPTTLAEGFQTTLLESIAEGGRVVTYPVPGAVKLRSQGAPVTIAQEQTANALLQGLETLLRELPPPADRDLVETWGWPMRAQQYEDVISRVVSTARDD